MIAIAPLVPLLFVYIEIDGLPVEAVCISVDLRPRLDCELTIVCLHIPPNKRRESIVPLYCLLNFISKRFPGSPLLITGDFNFHNVDWLHLTVKSGSNQSELHKSFSNFLNFYDLKQLVDKPTHVKENTLDLVRTNNSALIENLDIINPLLSNHFMIEWKIRFHRESHNIPRQIFNLYSKADKIAIKDHLNNTILEIENSINHKQGIKCNVVNFQK